MAFRFSSLTQFSLITLFLFFFSVSAGAKEITEEGANELKQLFSQMMEIQKSSASLGQGVMKLEGETQVELADGYYAVTLPHISFVNPAGGIFDVGIISINAVPSEKPDLWKMSIAIPSPMTGYDVTGNPVVTFDIGKQRMSGVWHKELSNFVKLDAAYENVVLHAGPENDGFMIPSIAVTYDLEESAPDYWSGPVNISLNEMKLAADGKDIMSAAKISIQSQITGLSVKAINDYKEKLAAIGESVEELEPGEAASSEHVVGMYNLVFDFFGTAWDGVTSDFVIEGLEVSAPAEAESPERKIKIGKAGFGVDLTGFRDNRVTFGYRIAYDGLEVTTPMAETQEFIPTNITVDFKIKEIPFKELSELGKSTLRSSLESPEMAKRSGMQAVMTIPQILSQTGTYLKINDVSVKGPEYSLTMDGTVNALAKAAFGLMADATGKVYGLDKMVAELTAKLNDPNTGEKERKLIQENIQALAVAQLMGRQEKDEQGRDVRVYDFNVNEQGVMTLNGVDMSALTGQAPPKAQPVIPQQQQTPPQEKQTVPDPGSPVLAE